MILNQVDLKEKIEEWHELSKEKKKLSNEVKKIKNKMGAIEKELTPLLKDGYAKLPDGEYLTKTVFAGGGSFTKAWTTVGFKKVKTMKSVNDNLDKVKGVLD